MSTVYGFQCKLYYNSASYETPTWVEVDNVEEVMLAVNYDEQEASIRAMGGTKATELTLRNIALTGKMLYQVENTILQKFENDFDARATIDFMALKGDDAVTDVTGYRFDGKIGAFDEDQGSGNIVFRSFSIKPCISANLPKAVTVTAGAPVFAAI